MKTVNAVVGSILAILGVIFIAGGAVLGSASCSNSNLGSVFTGLPTCSELVTEFFSAVIVGLIFLLVGGIVLLKGRQKVTLTTAPPTMSSGTSSQNTGLAKKRFCSNCGSPLAQGSTFCNSCGAKAQ